MNKDQILGVFFHWLPIGTAIVLVCGIVYVAVQQNYRSNLNDPQVQIAQDIATGLSDGRSLGQFSQQIDISKSLSTYVIIYDDKGEPLTASGLLDGEVPKPPSGVFEYTRENLEDRISWEPKPGVRSAIVVRYYKNDASSGFVLVGRNMSEIENRISRLGQLVCMGLLLALVISFGLDFVSDYWRKRATASMQLSSSSSGDDAKNVL